METEKIINSDELTEQPNENNLLNTADPAADGPDPNVGKNDKDDMAASGSAPAYTYAASNIPAAEPFTVTRRQKTAAWLTFALAYLYTYVLSLSDLFDWACYTPFIVKPRIVLGVFVIAFILVTEYLFRETESPKERWFWLGCTVLTAASMISGLSKAWDGYRMLILHAFAVYYVLARSGKLLDGRSGSGVLIDGWHAFAGWPLRHFFLNFRTIGTSSKAKKEKSEEDRIHVLTVVLCSLFAVIAALGLLSAAIHFLGQADGEFDRIFEKIRGYLDKEWLKDVLKRLFWMIPVCCYIFGILGGCDREKRETIDGQRANLNRFLQGLRRVPSAVWIALLGLFTIVYLLFFVLQARYLFSALFGVLPEGFTASGYARKGFFELCAVMMINFVLLWFVLYSADKEADSCLPVKLGVTGLMAESCLLAVTALSKLVLYIHRFGFTPLRVESSWLVAVLLLGCILALVRLWTGKKTFRPWLFAACGLLAATQFL